MTRSHGRSPALAGTAALAGLALTTAVAWFAGGCEDESGARPPAAVAAPETTGPDAPGPPPGSPEPDGLTVAGQWAPALHRWLDPPDGAVPWRWASRTGADRGRAVLTIAGRAYRWDFPDPPPAGPLQLVPGSTGWLPVRVASPAELAAVPPLPEIPLRSPAYPDLVSMLHALLTPRFDGVVPHWPDRPVPVRAPAGAISGEVDLTACLREAVANWNATAAEPFFIWDPKAAWGIRLAHYAGSLRSPPLQTQLIRRDAAGRPLHVRIAVGDDYHSAASRPHAVRGLAHELGHALLLWGHSPDRHHLLWGDAPPLRATPSPDERRAVRLRQRLPAGLDLGRYRR